VADGARRARLDRWLGDSGGLFLKIVGAIATTTAAVLGIREVFHLEGSVWTRIVAIYLCLVVTASLLLVVIQDRYRSRRVRYALAARPLHDAYHKLRDLSGSIDLGAPSDSLAPLLDESLTALAKAFSIITGSDCRTSVKELYSEDNSGTQNINPHNAMSLRPLMTRTLSRDTGSLAASAIRDESSDYVLSNTGHKRLLLANYTDRCFFANNLLKVNPYENTHWQSDEPREYLATIVWPIQLIKRSEGPDRRFDIRGFLAVDSLAIDTFRRNFDFDVGAAFADTLYPILKRWKSVSPDKGHVSNRAELHGTVNLTEVEGKSNS
jgi:hypothetical protein